MMNRRVTIEGKGPVHIVYKLPGKNGRRIYMDMIAVEDVEKELFEVKKDCVLFRYETDTTRAGKMTPIISLNPVRKLVYFWDNDKEAFDTRGEKVEMWEFEKWIY